MNQNIKWLCWVSLITLSLAQAEIVPEPLARLTVGADTLAEETPLMYGQYPIFGGEVGARLVLHRQSALWALLNLDSPSMGCRPASDTRVARSNLSLAGRIVVNPSLLVGGYVQGEALKAYEESNFETLIGALTPWQADASYHIGGGLDCILLPRSSKWSYPLQITLGGHYTVSDPIEFLHDSLIAYDIAGATLKVSLEYSKWCKYFLVPYYRYHGGKISSNPAIQENIGMALGAEYRFNKYVAITAQGEGDIQTGYHAKATLCVDMLGGQTPATRSLQSYLKSDMPHQVAPLTFFEELTGIPDRREVRDARGIPGVFPTKYRKQEAEPRTPRVGAYPEENVPLSPGNYATPWLETRDSASQVSSHASRGQGAFVHKQSHSSSGSFFKRAGDFLSLNQANRPTTSGGPGGPRRNSSPVSQASSYKQPPMLSPDLNQGRDDWLGSTTRDDILGEQSLTETTLINSPTAEESITVAVNAFLENMPHYVKGLIQAIRVPEDGSYAEMLLNDLGQKMTNIVKALASSELEQDLKKEREFEKKVSVLLKSLTKARELDRRLYLKASQSLTDIQTLYQKLNSQYASDSKTEQQIPSASSTKSGHRSQSKSRGFNDSSKRREDKPLAAGDEHQYQFRPEDSSDTRSHNSTRSRSKMRGVKEKPRSQSRGGTRSAGPAQSQDLLYDERTRTRASNEENKHDQSRSHRASSQAPSIMSIFGLKSTTRVGDRGIEQHQAEPTGDSEGRSRGHRRDSSRVREHSQAPARRAERSRSRHANTKQGESRSESKTRRRRAGTKRSVEQPQGSLVSSASEVTDPLGDRLTKLKEKEEKKNSQASEGEHSRGVSSIEQQAAAFSSSQNELTERETRRRKAGTERSVEQPQGSLVSSASEVGSSLGDRLTKLKEKEEKKNSQTSEEEHSRGVSNTAQEAAAFSSSRKEPKKVTFPDTVPNKYGENIPLGGSKQGEEVPGELGSDEEEIANSRRREVSSAAYSAHQIALGDVKAHLKAVNETGSLKDYLYEIWGWDEALPQLVSIFYVYNEGRCQESEERPKAQQMIETLSTKNELNDDHKYILNKEIVPAYTLHVLKTNEKYVREFLEGLYRRVFPLSENTEEMSMADMSGMLEKIRENPTGRAYFFNRKDCKVLDLAKAVLARMPK